MAKKSRKEKPKQKLLPFTFEAAIKALVKPVNEVDPGNWTGG